MFGCNDEQHRESSMSPAGIRLLLAFPFTSMKVSASCLLPRGCSVAAVALGLVTFWGREKRKAGKDSSCIRKVKAFSETLTLVLISQHFSHGLLTARKFKKLSILNISLLPLNEMWISFVRKRKKWLLDRKRSLPLVLVQPRFCLPFLRCITCHWQPRPFS